jgi:hypothetical protein
MYKQAMVGPTYRCLQQNMSACGSAVGGGASIQQQEGGGHSCANCQ